MPGRISSPTLIGRAGERNRLTVMLTGDEGWKPFVLVRGEAGIGKSRLLSAVLDDLRRDGRAVLGGACIPIAGATLPYGPIVEALDTELPDAPSALTAAAIRIRELISAATRPTVGGQPAAQVELFETVLGALAAVGSRRQVVLAIEDLHWSDASTRDLLAFLAHRRVGPWLRIVGTLRNDEPRSIVGPLLTELDRHGGLDAVDLEPLGPDAVREVIIAIRGEEPTDAVWRDVVARAGGNPFFVEELLASGSAEHIGLSPSLGEMLLTRLAPLPKRSLDVLRHMAVLGDRVREPLLAAIIALDPTALARGLRPAVEAQVVTVDDATATYAFRHALVREALYADLLPGERTALHRRAAAVLEGPDGERLLGPTERLLAVATQLDAAGEAGRALAVLPDAATAASGALAHGDAYRLYERAIARWIEAPEVGESLGLDLVDLHWRAANAAERTDDVDGRVAHLVEAMRIREATGRGEDPALMQSLSAAQWLAGDEAGSMDMAERAYRAVPADGDPELRLLVASAWQSMLAGTSREDEALAVTEEVIDLVDGAADRMSAASLLAIRGYTLLSKGMTDQGTADLERAVAISLDLDDPEATLMAIGNAISGIGLLAGDTDRALELEQLWREQHRRMGLDQSRAEWMAGPIGAIRLNAGDWAEADRMLSDAARSELPGPVRQDVNVLLATLRTWQARPAEARALLDDVWPTLETAAGPPSIGPLYAAAAELAAWSGEPERAAELIDEGRQRLVPDDPFWSRAMYAIGARAVADMAEATSAPLDRLRSRAAELASLLCYEGSAFGAARTPETGAWRAHAQAEVARIGGTPREVERAWEAAASAWKDIGRPHLRAYALLRQAKALVQGGDRRAAREPVSEAAAIARGIGAAVLELWLAELGSRDAATAPEKEQPFGLTPREIEVLGLVSEGLSNREIATQLFISEKTAGVHVSNILAKLDVSSRVQAASRAVRAGIVKGWAAPAD